MITLEQWLVLEGVHVRRAAFHKQENDALGPRPESGRLAANGFSVGNNDVNANDPKPRADCCNMSRREVISNIGIHWTIPTPD